MPGRDTLGAMLVLRSVSHRLIADEAMLARALGENGVRSRQW